MVEANIKIIEDLKEVLRIINSDLDVRKYFVTQASDFTRKRKLTYDRTVFFDTKYAQKKLIGRDSKFF